MKNTSIIILFLLTSNNIFSSIIVTENVKNALKKVYELKFNEANELINNEDFENKYSIFISNYIDFLKVILNEKEIDYKRYKKNFIENIDILENENNDSPEYFSTITEMYFQMSVSNFKMGETYKGALNFYKTYRLLLQGIVKYPKNENLLKIFAFFKILFGSVPDEYIWITDLIGIKGDINSGLDFINYKYFKYCNETSEKSIEYSILKIIANDIFSEEYSNNISLKTNNLENPLFRISYIIYVIHHGKSNIALEITQKFKQDSDEYKIDYFDYLQGIVLLYKLDSNANIYLENFAESFKGRNFLKSAYQKLSWYYLIFNNLKKYDEYLNLIKKSGFNQFDADKQAINEITHYNTENISLLKARLLFDGGYYKKSDSILESELNNTKLKNYHDEILYRLARNSQESDNKNVAVKFYNQLINDYNSETNYYCAVAFMNLGLIYEKSANYKLSKENYLLCLKSKNKQYRNSIQHKAKAGLNRIKDKKI